MAQPGATDTPHSHGEDSEPKTTRKKKPKRTPAYVVSHVPPPPWIAPPLFLVFVSGSFEMVTNLRERTTSGTAPGQGVRVMESITGAPQLIWVDLGKSRGTTSCGKDTKKQTNTQPHTRDKRGNSTPSHGRRGTGNQCSEGVLCSKGSTGQANDTLFTSLHRTHPFKPAHAAPPPLCLAHCTPPHP